jgi:cyanophycin synthetase
MVVGTERPVIHLPDSAPPALDGAAPLDWDSLAAIARERISLGAGWLRQAMGEDGRFDYYYRPANDRVHMEDYNEVRHAGTTYAMFQAYDIVDDPALLEAAEKAVAWIDAACLPTPYGGKAFSLKNRCILGGQALALVALLERRRVLQDTSYDDLIADLAIFLDLLELQETPGQHFEIYRLARDRFSTTDDPSYSPGEVALAQVRLAQHFPDGPFVDAASRVADFLIHRRDGDIIAAGTAARMDHWMVMALSELYPMTGHPHHAEAAFLVGDLMRAAQYQPGSTTWRLLGANPRGESANYTSTATKGEAFMAAWDLAIHLGDDARIAQFSQSALRNAQFLMRVQYTEELASRFRNPPRVVGGWAQDERVSDIRVDYVQHNVSALIGSWHLLTEGRLPAGRRQAQPGAELAVRIPVLGTEIFSGPSFCSIRPAVSVVIDTRALPDVPIPSGKEIRALAVGALSEAVTDGFAVASDRDDVDGQPETLAAALAVALRDVQRLAGWDARAEGTRRLTEGRFQIYCEIEDEESAAAAVDVAVNVIEDLINGRRRAVAQATKHRQVLFKPRFPQNLGITPRLIIEARRRGIRHFERSDKSGFIEFGTGSCQKQMRKAITSESSTLGHRIAKNKNLAAVVMQRAGLPAPRNRRVRAVQEAVKAANAIGYPVVLKPLDGSQSLGVFPGIRDDEGVRRCFAESQKISRQGDVVVESYLEGESYRIFLVGNEVVGALERRRAEVIGDGIHTVAELIELENASPARQPRLGNYLEPIDVDDQTLLAIEWQGLSMDAVPEAGRVVTLKLIPSGSNGGTRIDRLADMHPDNIEIARQAAATVNLAVTGIDFISPDITKSVWETGGGIVEINGAPAYYPHCRPSSGRSFDPVVPVMEMLFPPGAPVQIRAIAIAGAPNPETLSRLIATLIASRKRHIGIALPDTAILDGMPIGTLSRDSPTPVQIVVRNPLLDTAILVPGVADFSAPGLEIDELDVAIVGSSVSLPTDGVLSAAQVMARMAERSGVVVVDADDPERPDLVGDHSGQVLMISTSGVTAVVSEHLLRGGQALVSDRDMPIALHSVSGQKAVVKAADVAALLESLGDGDLQTLLFGIAAAIGFGVDSDTLSLTVLESRNGNPRTES